MRLPWLLVALMLAALLATLDRIALEYFIYWRYPWSDTIVHFTGGAMLGAFATALLRERFRPLLYLGFVVAVSVGWEVFEYLIGASTPGKGFFLDTSSDLLFDALGASFVYVIARLTSWRSA